MAGRVIRSGFRRGGVRRQMDWIAGVDRSSFVTLAAATKSLDGSFPGTGIPAAPFTVTRVRGSLYVKSDQQTSSEVQQGAVGMGIVSTVAATAGAASIPGPVTDAPWDGWFLWLPFANAFVVSSAVAVTNTGSLYHFDSRAQRKVESLDSIAIMVENASGTTGFEYFLQYRILLKMH